MKKSLLKSILSACFIALSFFAYSQSGGVAISNTNTTAHPSSVLDVSSPSSPYQGMLIPRMTTANRNTIVSPATGLQIFNTDCGVNEYYTGTCWVSMSQNLRPPNPITCSGTTDFCANGTRTFTIPAVNGATTYFWTVPAGATITSGQGTTSATVLFGNHSGDVCVTAENDCEASQPRCINIYINPVPPTPGNITGPTTIIPGTSASYFIAGVAGVNLYSWTVPSGATITAGAGTTSITVNFSCSAVSGNITVAAQNNCGASPTNALGVTLNTLVANAGPNIGSPGTLGGSPTASGGTSSYTYAWAPSTNLSSTTVANPTTTVCTSTTYTVTVTDGNGCTSSSSATATVNPAPATPGPISGNASPACNATGEVYSISPVTYATSYTWTVPSGASIVSGQGTTSITVNFGNTFGNITVTASNACGTSGASTLSVNNGASCSPITFNYTGSQQTFTVPSGVTSLTIEAWGAKGGNSSQIGRNGGYTKGTLSATPGTVYYVYAGGQGGTPAAGFNGGGAGGVTPQSTGGGGGGASDIRTGGTNLSNRIMVAAGGGGSAGTDSWGGYPGTGGGGGFCSSPNGYGGQGALGCAQGTDGGCSPGSASGYGSGGAGAGLNAGGMGGGDSGAGSVNGGTGTLGIGGDGGSQAVSGNPNGGGGGGGGYYGGGGGASGSGGCNGAGGGGSSYVNNSIFSSISFTAGLQAGNGKVTFSW